MSAVAAARVRKPRVAKAPDAGAYPHMAAEAARVGWPLRFPGDLHEHDRGFLAKRPPSTPILWHLGSGCTQIRDMIAPTRRGRGNSTLEWLKAVRESYPDTRVYGWDGTTLREFASDDAAREWCEQYPDTYLLARGELQARPSRSPVLAWGQGRRARRTWCASTLERWVPMAKWLSVLYRGETQYVLDTGVFPQETCDDMVQRLGAPDATNRPRIAQVAEDNVPAWMRPAASPRTAVGSAVVAAPPSSVATLDEAPATVVDRAPVSSVAVAERPAPLHLVPTAARMVPAYTAPDAARGDGCVDAAGEARAKRDREAAIKAGFAPARTLYQIGSRVVDIGVDNAKAKRAEWEASPVTADACATLARTVRHEDRQETIAALADIRMEANGTLQVPGLGACWLSEDTLRKFLGSLGYGGAHYLAQVWPSLRAHNVNALVGQLAVAEREAEQVAGRGRKEWQPEQVKVRHRAGRGGEREVFALVSPSYASFDADRVMEALALAAPDGARGGIHYDATATRTRAEVWFHSTVAPEDYVCGEFFRAGAVIGTRDDGGGALWGQAVAEQNLCLNLIITDMATSGTFRIRHVGDPRRMAQEFRQGFKDCLGKIQHFVDAWGYCKKEDVRTEVRATTPKARDLGTELFYRGLFRNMIERELVTVRGEPDAAVRGLMLARERNTDSANEHSRAAISNAVTRWAHEGPAKADPWWQDALARDGAKLILGDDRGHKPVLSWSDPDPKAAARRK